MLIEYSSNNSGGSWWLEDKDWKNLEKAGWKVDWKKNDKDAFLVDDNGRFLGALADSASKDFPSVKDALEEFERITKQDVSNEGCTCCGAPHSFNWKEDGKYQYCSGEECLKYLHPEVDTNLTKRELIKELGEKA